MIRGDVSTAPIALDRIVVLVTLVDQGDRVPAGMDIITAAS